MNKVYLETNGCSVLRLDTQVYSKYFRENGWKEVSSAREADLVIFTGCAVIKKTENFAIESIKRLKEEMKDRSRLIVAGCLPAINPERLAKVFTGTSFSKENEALLDEIIGADKKLKDVLWTGDIIRKHSSGKPGLKYSKEQLRELKVAKSLSQKFDCLRFLEIYDYLTTGRFFWDEVDPVFEIKVADGCNYNCSYCATKNAKGDLKSIKPDKILKEYEIAVEKGHSKIVLTGDEVGDYGWNIGTSLPGLLEKLDLISKKPRIALRYVSPTSLTRDYEQLKPYFNSGRVYYFCSSFQSGSPKVLRLMERPTNIDEFLDLISEIDNKFPRVYKHTQIIVGFPRETEEDFQMTLDALERSGFDYITVVKYSDRPHTRSIAMEGHIKPSAIEERYKRAASFITELRRRKLEKLFFQEIIRNT